jgi:hypothetical protein
MRVGRDPVVAALHVFVWLLPFHIALMALLFGGLGVPGPTVRLLAAWKEALVAALLLVVALRALDGRGQRAPIHWLDLAIAGLGLVALVYPLGAGAWSSFELPPGARLYGLRDAVYFSLLYFVGRATPEVVRDERLLKALFLVGIVTSAVAVLERLFVTPAMLVLLGAAEYFQDFLGASLFTAGNPFGLPINYWVTVGGRVVQRAGSTYLSSQGFAIPFLIIMPAATVWLLARKRAAIGWVGYGLLWLGLLLTITRLTIVACLLQTVVIVATRRRWGLLTAGTAAGTLAFAAALLLLPGFATYVWETLTWQSASSRSHLHDWIEGMENALRYPLGAGLGVADQAAVRFGLDPLAGDNQYFKYAVELGILGLGLHLATLTGAALAGVRAAHRAAGVRAEYGMVLAVAGLGIMLNAMTAAVFNSMMLAYVFFWLLGSLVTANAMHDGA